MSHLTIKQQPLVRAMAIALAATVGQLAITPASAQELVDLDTLSSLDGLVINGIDANDYSGVSVSAAGDILSLIHI